LCLLCFLWLIPGHYFAGGGAGHDAGNGQFPSNGGQFGTGISGGG